MHLRRTLKFLAALLAAYAVMHNGACGWGWCSPTASGWVLLAVFWLSVAWLTAWALARLTRDKGEQLGKVNEP